MADSWAATMAVLKVTELVEHLAGRLAAWKAERWVVEKAAQMADYLGRTTAG